MPPYSIPILSPEIGVDVRLALILLSISPSMLVSWLQTRYPNSERALPLGWYSLVLLTIASTSYAFLGLAPSLLSTALATWMSLLLGLLLGALAIAVDLGTVQILRRLQQRRRRLQFGQQGPLPRGPVITAFADVPTGTEVVWRLHEHGRPWRSGLIDLLLVAILEECIYRQTLLALLATVFGNLFLPALLSTLGFGLIHVYFGLGSVVSKWVIGAMFMVAVLAGAGLAAVILAHCILNAAAYLVMSRASEKRATVRRNPGRAYSHGAG
jgi:MFS family permease